VARTYERTIASPEIAGRADGPAKEILDSERRRPFADASRALVAEFAGSAVALATRKAYRGSTDRESARQRGAIRPVPRGLLSLLARLAASVPANGPTRFATRRARKCEHIAPAHRAEAAGDLAPAIRLRGGLLNARTNALAPTLLDTGQPRKDCSMRFPIRSLPLVSLLGAMMLMTPATASALNITSTGSTQSNGGYRASSTSASSTSSSSATSNSSSATSMRSTSTISGGNSKSATVTGGTRAPVLRSAANASVSSSLPKSESAVVGKPAATNPTKQAPAAQVGRANANVTTSELRPGTKYQTSDGKFRVEVTKNNKWVRFYSPFTTSASYYDRKEMKQVLKGLAAQGVTLTKLP
jgi:hypothetical protein